MATSLQQKNISLEDLAQTIADLRISTVFRMGKYCGDDNKLKDLEGFRKERLEIIKELISITKKVIGCNNIPTTLIDGLFLALDKAKETEMISDYHLSMLFVKDALDLAVVFSPRQTLDAVPEYSLFNKLCANYEGNKDIPVKQYANRFGIVSGREIDNEGWRISSLYNKALDTIT